MPVKCAALPPNSRALPPQRRQYDLEIEFLFSRQGSLFVRCFAEHGALHDPTARN